MAAWRPFVLVLLPFATGYYLSYVFRTINALIAGDLTQALALNAADLGLLTSISFLTMAVVQAPLGILIDKFGPRRVQSACLMVAAVGSVVFAFAASLPGLMCGRALIGVGVASALLASLKAIVLWFPRERIGFANGCVVMVGALGAITATLPAETLVNFVGWRGLFLLLAGATVLGALLMFLVVPEAPGAPGARALSPVRLRDIYSDARFLRLAPLSMLCVGTAWSLQGLWAAPWLQEVDRLDRTDVVRHLLVMGVALSLGAIGLGWAVDLLRRRGVSIESFFACIAIAFMAAQLVLILRLPVPTYVPWAVIAAVGAATVVSFAILPDYFPKEMSARANSALSIMHLGGAFALQYLTGLVVALWPTDAGQPPPQAYTTAFALSLILQLAALLWFLVLQVVAIPTFLASRTTLGLTGPRKPSVNYSSARLVMAHHISGARAQMMHWRMIGVASAGLCVALLAAMLTEARAPIVVHVVESTTVASAHADVGFCEPLLPCGWIHGHADARVVLASTRR